MFVNYLQSQGIFAVACTIWPDRIEIGLLFVNSRKPPVQTGEIRLLDPSSDSYYPIVPPRFLGGWASDVSLTRIVADS